MSKHTPLKLCTSEQTGGAPQIRLNGKFISHVHYGGDEMGRLIVRACNNHEALLAACRDWIYLAFNDCMDLDNPEIKTRFHALCTQTRAAIAAAEKED